MTDKAPRTDWLTKLLGGKAEEVIADTVAAAEQLDAAGITRKELKPEDEEKKPEGEQTPPAEGEGQAPSEETPPEKAPEETPPPPEEEKEGDMVSEVGVKLAQQIFDAAQGNLSTLTQDQLGQVIADALRPAVDEETAPAPEPASEPVAPPPEREEDAVGKELTAAPTETTEKALGEMIVQMAKDQGEIVRNYQALVEKAAKEKALVPVVEELVKAIAEIRAQIGDRPRIASRAPETLVDAEDEAGKAIKEAAEKGVNREKTFMGVKVKNTPK
jgi:hypothetical protein